MIFKIKEFYLLIFLILLQSCSGGGIGNFLESSFENIENINNLEELKNVQEKKKVFKLENKESNKKNTKEIKTEELKNVQEKKKVFKLENKSDKINNASKDIKYDKKKKNELQSYKIIFILKDVDPEDPIKEIITILRNSEVNFEIDKIERFFESNN